MSNLETKYPEFFETLENVQEAFNLLELIFAEWQTDPKSVQCFDARTINRTEKLLNWKRENFDG